MPRTSYTCPGSLLSDRCPLCRRRTSIAPPPDSKSLTSKPLGYGLPLPPHMRNATGAATLVQLVDNAGGHGQLITCRCHYGQPSAAKCMLQPTHNYKLSKQQTGKIYRKIGAPPTNSGAASPGAAGAGDAQHGAGGLMTLALRVARKRKWKGEWQNDEQTAPSRARSSSSGTCANGLL